jgi:hypothetical protein
MIVAGGSNRLMIGPPGTGETLLADRLPAILPPLTPAEGLHEVRAGWPLRIALPEALCPLIGGPSSNFTATKELTDTWLTLRLLLPENDRVINLFARSVWASLHTWSTCR